MTIKEAITFICKREYNALRLDCNKTIKYKGVDGVRDIMDAWRTLKDNHIERIGNGLFKQGDKLIAKKIITYSERRACLCYYPVKLTIQFTEV